MIQHAATVFNTTKHRSRNHVTTTKAHVHNIQTKYQHWNKATHIHYFAHCLYWTSAYKKAHLILNEKNELNKRYTSDITKLISPQFHVVFDDNFETVQPPIPEIKMNNTMNRLFKTNNYKYDDPFGNKHNNLFSYGRVGIHPDSRSSDIKTCQ
jgi:hypothetical protein